MDLVVGKKEKIEHARDLNYEKLTQSLIKALQEEQVKIERLRAERQA